MNKDQLEVALKFSLDGAYLSIGESSPHEVCPVCNGGASGERSFRIRRVTSDLLTFRCYRNSCNASGCISVSGGTLVGRQSKSTKREVTYVTGGFDLLTEDELQVVERKCSTNRVALLGAGVRVDANTKRIMFPLYETTGELVGYCLRFYEGVSIGNPKPKALTHWFDEQARIALPSHSRKNNSLAGHIALFEDWPSAFRVHRAGYPAACLLGASVSMDTLKPLAVDGYTDVALVLDADARAQALRLKLQFSSLFRNFHAIMLSNNDVKDMNAAEFEEFMRSLPR